MKKLIILVLVVLMVQPVRAGIPTTIVADVPGAMEFLQTTLWWVDQLRKMEQQYDEAVRIGNAISGVRNLGDVLDSPELRKYLPDDMLTLYWAFKRSGYEGVVRSGVGIWNKNHVFDSCEHLDRETMPRQRLDCQTRAALPSQDAGIADELYAKTVQQGMQIQLLQMKINGSQDLAETAALQARIQAEQAKLANTANQIQIAAMASDAEQRALEVRRREFNALAYSAKRGTRLLDDGN